LLPAAMPALGLGEATGPGRRLQICRPRDAAWVKLAAAAQGLMRRSSRARRKARRRGGEGGEGGGYRILLKNLTTDAWVVIVILLLMFVIAVAVMVGKAQLVTRVGSANDRFLDRFRADLSGSGLARDTEQFTHSTLYRLYTIGEGEIAKRRAQGVQTLSGASLDAIKATLDAVQVRENHVLNARMVLLTIAISGGPFLGLLGTVVGVMITFAAIAATGEERQHRARHRRRAAGHGGGPGRRDPRAVWLQLAGLAHQDDLGRHADLRRRVRHPSS
jgi:biopolymer transport protein ExbB